MLRMVLLLGVVAGFSLGAAAQDSECSVAVMNLQAKGLPDDQQHVPELLTDSLAAEIAKTTDCKVITQADIAQMLDFEATKAACSDASESCVAEIGQALGVQRIIGGSVGMLGQSFKLQVKLQNIAEARVEGRVDKLIGGQPEALDLAARNAGRELFGVELLSENAEAREAHEAAEEVADEQNIVETESALPTVLLVSGVGLAVVGALAAAGGLGLGGFSILTIDSSGSFFGQGRKDVQTIGAVGEAVGLVGIGVVVLGAALITTSFILE